MRLFDMLDRWQVLAEAALVVVIVELGAYYFVYLPNRSVAPGPSQGRDVAESVEETAPKTPSRRSTPPPSKTQYQP